MFGMPGSAVARACDLKKTGGWVGTLFRARELVVVQMAGACRDPGFSYDPIVERTDLS